MQLFVFGRFVVTSSWFLLLLETRRGAATRRTTAVVQAAPSPAATSFVLFQQQKHKPPNIRTTPSSVESYHPSSEALQWQSQERRLQQKKLSPSTTRLFFVLSKEKEEQNEEQEVVGVSRTTKRPLLIRSSTTTLRQRRQQQHTPLSGWLLHSSSYRFDSTPARSTRPSWGRIVAGSHTTPSTTLLATSSSTTPSTRPPMGGGGGGTTPRKKTTRTTKMPPSAISESRRRELLSRPSSFFQLDPWTGTIEFGATVHLKTQLVTSKDNSSTNNSNNKAMIDAWLRDAHGLACSIWDEKLMQIIDTNQYRLNLMTIQFITLQLAPWVELYMETIDDDDTSNDDPTTTSKHEPVFQLRSMRYDPNIQLFPGMKLSSQELAIKIDVAGELRTSSKSNNYKGVEGAIAFSTRGLLPPPLRLVPESVVKATADSINQTIIKFAIQNFERGARTRFQQFQFQQQQQKQQEQEQRQAETIQE